MSDDATVGARTAAAALVSVSERHHPDRTMTDVQRAAIVAAVAEDLGTALAATAVDYEARVLLVEKLTRALADIAITAGNAAVWTVPAVQALKADVAPIPKKAEAS